MLAIAGLILSMALVAIGNGLMFAYIPVSLGADGYPPTWAGSILTGLSAGGIAGCLLTAPLVRRVGHARAFMVLLGADRAVQRRWSAPAPIRCCGSPRASLYGFAICGHVHRRAELAERRRRQRDPRPRHGDLLCQLHRRARRRLVPAELRRHRHGAEAPLVGIAFTALSILPVGMTRLRQPPAPDGASVALRRGLAHLAGRHCRHAGRRRPVDDDRRLRADPRHRKGLQPAGSGAAAVRHAARHADLPDPARLDLRPHRPPLRADRRLAAGRRGRHRGEPPRRQHACRR